MLAHRPGLMFLRRDSQWGLGATFPRAKRVTPRPRLAAAVVVGGTQHVPIHQTPSIWSRSAETCSDTCIQALSSDIDSEPRAIAIRKCDFDLRIATAKRLSLGTSSHVTWG